MRLDMECTCTIRSLFRYVANCVRCLKRRFFLFLCVIATVTVTTWSLNGNARNMKSAFLALQKVSVADLYPQTQMKTIGYHEDSNLVPNGQPREGKQENPFIRMAPPVKNFDKMVMEQLRNIETGSEKKENNLDGKRNRQTDIVQSYPENQEKESKQLPVKPQDHLEQNVMNIQPQFIHQQQHNLHVQQQSIPQQQQDIQQQQQDIPQQQQDIPQQQQNIPQQQQNIPQQNIPQQQQQNISQQQQNIPQQQQQDIPQQQQQNIPQQQQQNIPQQDILQQQQQNIPQQQQQNIEQQDIPRQQQQNIQQQNILQQQQYIPQKQQDIPQQDIQQQNILQQQQNIPQQKQNIPQQQQDIAQEQQDIQVQQQILQQQHQQDLIQQQQNMVQQNIVQQQRQQFLEPESMNNQPKDQHIQDLHPNNLSNNQTAAIGGPGQQVRSVWPPPYLMPLPYKEDLPVIISWTDMGGRRDYNITCKTRKCRVTHDHEERHRHDVLGMFFYGTEFASNGLPLPRKPGHLWSVLHEESPKNNDWLFCAKDAMKLFNLTATFRRESHYPFPTMWLPDESDLASTEYVVPLERKNQLRREGLAPIVFVHSDCYTPSDRSHYMRLLQQHVKIDSYGKCEHNKEFPHGHLSFEHGMGPMQSPDFYKVLAQYKFAFAFENAVCPDYVTEKFWRPLKLGVVPIAFGSPKIKDLAPSNHSIIDIRDFRSVKEVADFIIHLDTHDDEYARYTEYKTKGVTNPVLRQFLDSRDWGKGRRYDSQFTGFQCFICEKVHELQEQLVAGKPATQWQGSRDHYGCPLPKLFNEEGQYSVEKNFWWEPYSYAHYYLKSLNHHIDTIQLVDHKQIHN